MDGDTYIRVPVRQQLGPRHLMQAFSDCLHSPDMHSSSASAAVRPGPRSQEPPLAQSPAWLAALRSGNPDAITACYREHADALLTLALRLTGERADAEDVVQDVFVGLPQALRRYEERGVFAAWLRGLTMRHALGVHRRVRNRREVPHGAESLTVSVPAAAPSGDGHHIERALGTLTDGLRHVFVLRVIEGHSHAEIAALLGITPGTSEVRLSRAIKALRGQLGDLK
jgi:RNA polymerase sigma-70 factor, ECF subfamily